VPEVFGAMLAYSIWLLFLDKFLSGKDWVFYLLAIRAFAVITLAVYALATRQSLRVTDRSLWKYLAVMGVFDVGAFSAVSYGYSHTSYIGVVTVLSATFSLVTMLLAYLFLHERISRVQLAAAGLVICGIVVISLG
jgi:drug/metabolite transporter (DMT)-like permease